MIYINEKIEIYIYIYLFIYAQPPTPRAYQNEAKEITLFSTLANANLQSYTIS